MRKWHADEHPGIFESMHRASEVFPDRSRAHPEDFAFMASIEPWERHIPVREEALAEWRREVPCHGGSSYGKILERHIRLAEECNARYCEMIVSHRRKF